jgi:hypothetical protein
MTGRPPRSSSEPQAPLLSSPRSLRCRVPSSAVTLSGTGVSPAQPRTAAHAHRSRWRRQDATGAAGCRPSPGIRPRRRMDDRLRLQRSESTIRGYLARQQMPPADGHDAQGQHLRPWWHPVTADRWIGGSRGQTGVPPRPPSPCSCALHGDGPATSVAVEYLGRDDQCRGREPGWRHHHPETRPARHAFIYLWAAEQIVTTGA